MNHPTKKEIEKFIRTEFPDIEFDGIKFQECRRGNVWFKVFSFGRMIAQADYELGDQYWEKVKNHLKWTLG